MSMALVACAGGERTAPTTSTTTALDHDAFEF
jgi:hypothetical protein